MTINLLNKNNDQSDLNLGFDVAPTPAQSVSLFPDSADVDSNADTDSKYESEPLRPQFWSRFALTELNHSEWEALCG
jgi:hypothetical protein